MSGDANDIHSKTLPWDSVFCVAVALIAFVGSLTPSFQKCIAENAQAFFPCEAEFLDSNGVLITAVATIAIAWFTFSLRQSTEKMWKAGGEQIQVAKDAAVAARLSADAAVAAERARFYVSVRSDGFGAIIETARRYPNSRSMPVEGRVAVKYNFTNCGKTPGVIREISHGIMPSATPTDPVYTVVSNPGPSVIRAGDTSATITCEQNTHVDTIADALPFAEGQRFFWFYGKIEYDDVFGNQQLHRFYLRFVNLDGGFAFQPYDYKHYNKST